MSSGNQDVTAAPRIFLKSADEGSAQSGLLWNDKQLILVHPLQRGIFSEYIS